ncbi:MAG: hypothetical protein HOE62_08490 [Alphaproteobacteria bacterium]|jgi:hypothetical protein|nr:hypothetical protein [Alphaproteobacteria bacterium]MBT4017974.1 hypothetical protein [Alphaproteobacteria bacterium]MBT5158581.1 hypothetical protein [Alphaproteobacteria bacterium]MBT5919156.1 hypothetical protein [Alphaproteobacteria bacterium]MBT6384891.1 hypothetical protein [Alphaproteobacteria bacterium]
MPLVPTSIFGKPVKTLAFVVALLAGFVAGLPNNRAAAEGNPVVASPQPASLKPGLKVGYYVRLFKTVEEIQDWAKYKDAFPGEPLHSLDYRSGIDTVLTSSMEDGVGAHITGFIRIDEAGTYAFAAQSNDGLSVDIGGTRVVYDPDVHADRYSQPVEVEIKTVGWYPVNVWYFERKNTSTLRLYWLKPDEEEGSMTIVPKEVFGH